MKFATTNLTCEDNIYVYEEVRDGCTKTGL